MHDPLIWSFAGPVVLVIVVSMLNLVLPVGGAAEDKGAG